MRPYAKIRCDKCGADIAENWYIQHVKSGCQRGLPSQHSRRANHLKAKIAELQMALADATQVLLTLDGATMCVCEHTLDEHIFDERLTECVLLACDCRKFRVKI